MDTLGKKHLQQTYHAINHLNIQQVSGKPY